MQKKTKTKADKRPGPKRRAVIELLVLISACIASTYLAIIVSTDPYSLPVIRTATALLAGLADLMLAIRISLMAAGFGR